MSVRKSKGPVAFPLGEGDIYLLFHLLNIHWFILPCALTRDQPPTLEYGDGALTN